MSVSVSWRNHKQTVDYAELRTNSAAPYTRWQNCKRFFTNNSLDIKSNPYHMQKRCLWRILNVSVFYRFPITSNYILHLHSHSYITHWFAQSRQQNYLLPLCVNRQQVSLNYKLNSHRWLANIVPAMCSGQMTSAGFIIDPWLYQQVVRWFGFRVKDVWNGDEMVKLFKHLHRMRILVVLHIFCEQNHEIITESESIFLIRCGINCSILTF